MQEIQDKWFNITTCTDSRAKMHSDRLSIDSFWGLYLITRTASLTALFVFFSLLLHDYRRDLNVRANDINSEMHDPSSKRYLKSLARALQSFIEYVDQKRSSTSGPKPIVSEVSIPFDLETLSRISFSFFNHEHKHVAGAN